MKKCRIVKKTYPDGKIEFVIQQKHWLFFWQWVDASINSPWSYERDTFSFLEDAENNIWKFKSILPKEQVVKEID